MISDTRGHAMLEQFYELIGSDPQTITWWQMSIRACIVFFYILFVIRFGSLRAFGRSSSFDIVLAILLGSTLSRALTGNSRFLPTLAATAVLVILHRLLALLSFRSNRVAEIVKGKEIPLVKNGNWEPEAMKKTGITRGDIAEALRLQRGLDDMSSIRDVYLERSGKISMVKKQ
jgi:uncharacterized membrane protein YcaP (DUF421 family)